MKPIRDLLCLWRALPCSLRIKSAPVSADDLNFRVLLEPRRRFLYGTLWQHVDDFPALQIDDDRSIAISPAPAPIIDANHSYGLSIADASRIVFEMPQNSIVAHLHS
jgi:hypothetical protein